MYIKEKPSKLTKVIYSSARVVLVYLYCTLENLFSGKKHTVKTGKGLAVFFKPSKLKSLIANLQTKKVFKLYSTTYQLVTNTEEKFTLK